MDATGVSGTIERRDDGGIVTLTLTRPPINALDGAALEELGAAVERVAVDAEARVVILSSGLPDVFCAGGDLKFWRRFPRGMARTVSRAGRDVFEQIEQLPQPTIAAIDGAVIGDGLALALAADLRVASDPSTFRTPEAEYGFIPGWGIIGRLREQLGITAALEMLLMASAVTAERARQLGLVTDVVARGDALLRARQLAGVLAAKSPQALRWLKRALRSAPTTPSGERWEEDCFAEVWGGEDWQEGIDALFARRPPVFAGRPSTRGT